MGDVIVAVNGEPVYGKSLAEVAAVPNGQCVFWSVGWGVGGCASQSGSGVAWGGAWEVGLTWVC